MIWDPIQIKRHQGKGDYRFNYSCAFLKEKHEISSVLAIQKLLNEIVKSDIVKLHAMWGFGMYLMHLADYLTRRKYNKEERRKESRQQRIVDRKKCRICGKDFDNGSRLGTHMKEKHPGIL